MANRALLIVFSAFLFSCAENFYVKENLSQNQILDPAIIRKPTGVKSWGLVPVYEDTLEGYVSGGLMDSGGQPIQGVEVKVQDEKGNDLPSFGSGFTDQSGVYKIRFSIPIIWGGIDLKGNLSLSSGWRPAVPQTKFRLYFNRSNGVLSYTIADGPWLTVQNENAQSPTGARPPLPSQERNKARPSSGPAGGKKSDDIFGNFGFGP